MTFSWKRLVWTLFPSVYVSKYIASGSISSDWLRIILSEYPRLSDWTIIFSYEFSSSIDEKKHVILSYFIYCILLILVILIYELISGHINRNWCQQTGVLIFYKINGIYTTLSHSLVWILSFCTKIWPDEHGWWWSHIYGLR